jgi:hypothetical protein
MYGKPFMLTIDHAHSNLMGNITRSKRTHRNQILFGGASIGRWVSSKFRCSPLPKDAESDFLAVLLLGVDPFRFKDDGNPIGTVCQGTNAVSRLTCRDIAGRSCYPTVEIIR